MANGLAASDAFGASTQLWAFGLYVYWALTLHVIANKTQTEFGWMAWIPILNLYLMCKCAGKSGWWILLLLIPLVNIITYIVIWINIAEARGKSSILGVLMILPGINLIVMGYLAFSD